MSKGRRVSFYASPQLVRMVGNWLVNDYRPIATILGRDAQDQEDRQLARVIGRWLLEQVEQSRKFERRPIGIILPRRAMKWLARNLPSGRRFGIVHSRLYTLGRIVEKFTPAPVGRHWLSSTEIRARLEPGYKIDLRQAQRLRSRLKRTN